MGDTLKRRIQHFVKGQICQTERSVVQEAPLRLTVNGRELATLVASPHQLNFLVAGFLRNQGFVDTMDDILCLGTCQGDPRATGADPDVGVWHGHQLQSC